MASESTKAAFEDILKSRREILALLKKIQERKKQQAAQFEGLHDENESNTSGVGSSALHKEGQSLQDTEYFGIVDKNNSQYQKQSKDDNPSNIVITHTASISNTGIQIDYNTVRVRDRKSSHNESIITNEDDSILDIQSDLKSEENNGKLNDRTHIQKKSMLPIKNDSITHIQSGITPRIIENKSKQNEFVNRKEATEKDGSETTDLSLMNSRSDNSEPEITDATNKDKESLITGDISVVLKDPSITRKCQGFKCKRTSSAHDNRLLLKAESGIWCTDIQQLTEDDEEVIRNTQVLAASDDFKNKSSGQTDKFDSKDNTHVIEIRAQMQKHEVRQLVANRRVIVQIERWSDLANDEMRRGRIARETRCNGPDTVICLDVSASMNGESFAMAKTFIKDYIAEIQNSPNTDGNYEHVSLVTFGKQTKVQIHLTYEYYEILSALDSLRPGGPSPLFAGLKMCMAAILAAGKVSSPPVGSSHAKIYLVTDGRVTPSEFAAGPDTCTDIEKRKEQDRVISYCIDLYQKYRLTINIVCVGDSNGSFLESITKNTGGKLFLVETEEDENQKDEDEPNEEAANKLEDSLEFEDEAFSKDSLEMYHDKQRELDERRLTIEGKQNEKEERTERRVENYIRTRPATPIPLDLLGRYGGIGYPYDIDVQSSNDSSDSEVEIQPEDRDDLFPPLGGRVRTKADPLCGTITRRFRNGVQVTWDGISERGCVREDICEPDCLEIVNQSRVLTDEIIAVGCKVKRNWRYEDQDGHPGNEGVVIEVNDSGVVSVCWNHGPVYKYRFGSDGKFEIEVVQPSVGLKQQERPLLDVETQCQDASEGQSSPQHRPNNAAGNTQGSTDNSAFRWRWKDVNGKWNFFSDDVNVTIEDSYNNNNRGSVFIILQDKRYKILFSRMVKVDLDTQTKYPVSRTTAES